MIPVDQLTEQKLQIRYESLPRGLKEALDSQTNISIITQACKNHHLIDEERVLMVQQLVGLVLLGFVHSYDIGKEINDALELGNPKLATSIAEELGAKIFTPIKSDIESNYEPVFEEAPQSLYTASLQKPKPGEGVVELDSLRINIPKPAPLSTIDPRPTPPPAPPQMKPAASILPPVPVASPAPITQMPTAPKQNATPIPKSGTPPPIMLHQESTAEPVKQMPGFSVGSADQLRGAKQDERPPARPAHLELGGVPLMTAQPKHGEEAPISSRALPAQPPRLKFDLSGIKPAGDALPRPAEQKPPAPQWPMPPIGESRTVPVPPSSPAPRFTPPPAPPQMKPAAPILPPVPVAPVPPPRPFSPTPTPPAGITQQMRQAGAPPPSVPPVPATRKEEVVNLDSLRKIAKDQ